MKRVLMAAVALSTLAAAVPAAAQSWRDGGYRPGPGGQGEQLERRIHNLADRGLLTRREAGALQAEVNAVQRLQWRYGRDGFSQWERRDLDRRYDRVAMRLRFEARDNDRRGDRYGYGYGRDYGDRRW